MSEFLFKIRYVVKHDFTWTWLSAQTFVVAQLANPGRLFIYVFIITSRNLIKVLCQYFNNIEPACGGVNHRREGQTNIIPNYSAICLVFSARLAI